MIPLLPLAPGWLVNSYAFFMSAGFAVAFLLVLSRARRAGLDEDRALTLLISIFLSSLAGARAFFVWEAWPYFAARPIEIPLLWHGGLSFYGGLVFGVATAVIMARRLGASVRATLDLLTPALALGHAFGRLGCLYHGCCYGRVTSGPLGVVFANGPADHLARHPTQAYECVALVVLYLVTLHLTDRKGYSAAGRVTGFYLVAYAVLRFALENLRDDMVGPVFAGLFRYQWVSVGVLAAGVVLLVSRGQDSSSPMSPSLR